MMLLEQMIYSLIANNIEKVDEFARFQFIYHLHQLYIICSETFLKLINSEFDRDLGYFKVRGRENI